ncbi:MAG TPA: dihydrofolate reductase family protein [Candidatus Limnocylindrales bacterium]|nr:dihydrofolate reductase family protein [Candidatus Limnocylindrales bacterium]
MGRLVYGMNVSLDGYVADADGGLEWTIVDDEIHGWWNDRIREAEAYLYGRRIYELMAAHWPTAEADPDGNPTTREFGRIWTAAPKIVFSSTLEAVAWNSRLERSRIEDVIDRIRTEFNGDLDVAGPTLAAPLIRRNQIDVYHLVVHPTVLGAGLPFFPDLERPIGLRLVATRRFESGAFYLGYEAIR